MPKETTYGLQMAWPEPNTTGVSTEVLLTSAPEGVTPGAVTNPPAKPRVPIVDVLWNREGGMVQVVTKATDADGGRWAADSPETHFTDGMYVDLDRAGINRLIRNLRRARDNAFGRDE